MTATRKPRKCKPDEDKLVGLHLRVHPQMREFFMNLENPSRAMRIALGAYMDRNCS